MSPSTPPPAARAGHAVVYRIRANGCVDGTWSSRLGGMALVTNDDVTTLTGPVRDQSELMGVLNTLHMLRLTVMSVERLDDEVNAGQ